ncbi:MAG: recombinase family protein, partial [Saprospiraceae bacterium]
MLGIYCRTSKNREEKYTIQNQREGGIACAKKLGLGFRVYIDDGISGTLDESVRDGLSDLFKDIRKKVITHVYCINQSRIERDTKTWNFFVAECINNNIVYMPGGSPFDLDNPNNRMFAQLMSIVNAYYTEITSKTVRLANARKAKDGKTHGLKAYGYSRDEKNNYIINESEAKQVKRMFALSLSGTGAYTIANMLNEEGVPTKFSGNFKGVIKRKDKFTKAITHFDKSKVRWRGNVIYDILKNKIYKGVREWNRHEDIVEYQDGKLVKKKVIVEQIIAKVPSIVSEDLWERVNLNLEKNKKAVGKKAEYKYLLNGLIFCADCNREFVGKKRLVSGDNAYKCKGKIYPHPSCKISRGISINKLDSFLIKHLFKSKNLKESLIGIPKDDKGRAGLLQRIGNEKKKLTDFESRLRIARKRLLIPELEDDEFLVSSVLGLKNI